MGELEGNVALVTGAIPKTRVEQGDAKVSETEG